MARWVGQLLSLGLLLTALGCAPAGAGPAGTPTPAPPAPGGVQGHVLIGPLCPVVRVDTPCPDQPYQATLTILDGAGQTVGQAQSDAQGFFQVALPAGAYTLHPEASGLTRAPDQDLVIRAGQWLSVTVTYDSGIR